MNKTFLIVSRAKLIKEKSIDSVVSNLQTTFKLSSNTAKSLVTDERIIKKGLSIDQAKTYKTVLQKCGLVSDVLEEHSTEHLAFLHAQDYKVQKQEIKNVLSGDPFSFKASSAYQLGLVCSALLSLISPVLYFLLVGGFGYLTYWFSVNMFILESKPFGLSTFPLWAYVCILFLLTVITTFLVRPLFLQSKKPVNRLILNRKNNPTFYALVEELCRKFNQPMPQTIYISNDVNAYVAPKSGLVSVFRKQLTLTVGAPIIASLNKRQLVGVLSHEFGHFNQRTAMITHYIINSVSFWLASRIWGEDRLEKKLKNWGEEQENWFGLAAISTQFCIKCTRQFLKIFYYLNLFISQKMSRQMEYDADKYESYISGSDYFENTSIMLRRVSLGEHYAHTLNKDLWDTNQLLIDLPDAIAHETECLHKEDLAQIYEQMNVKQTDWWESHPADFDRVSHARSLKYEGLWKDEGPAKDFIGEFESICKKLTLIYYQGRGFTEKDLSLIDYSDALDKQKENLIEDEALDEFQFGMASYRCFYVADKVRPKADLKSLIEELEDKKADWIQAENDYWFGRSHTTEAILAKLHLESGLEAPDYLDKNYKTLDQCNEEIMVKSQQWERAKVAFREIDELICQRISLAMRVVSKDVRQQLTLQLRFFKLLERTEGYWLDLRRNHWILKNLLDDNEYYEDKFNSLIDRYCGFLQEDLNNFISIAFEYDISLRNEPSRKFSWWFGEWAGDYSSTHKYKAEELLNIVDQFNHLIFFLISKSSSSIAVHCLDAEKLHLKSQSSQEEPA